MSSWQIRQLSFGEKGVQQMIEHLVKRSAIKPTTALGIMAIEENNYRAAKMLGCTPFADSVMRTHLTELLRLLLPRRHYRHIMGASSGEVLQIDGGRMLQLTERRN